MLTKDFWLGALERAVKTFIQTFVATLGVGFGVVYTEDSLQTLPWTSAAITAGVAAVLSVATSVGSPGFVAGKQNEYKLPTSDPGMVKPSEEAVIEVPKEAEEGLIEPFGEDDLEYLPRHADETSE
jgi:gp21|nr:MAG TPA: holin [Caudoviricetes sp.]